MSDNISIQVSIAGRKYPLTIAKKDESLILEIAGKLNNTIDALKSNYSVKDKQDLLAMAALQVSTKESLRSSSSPSENQDLSDLEALLERSKHLI